MLIHEACAQLRSIIIGHGGYVFKMVGDAVYAAFAVATDAVEAAVAAQRAVAAEEWGEVGPLRVRMALHTGAVQSRGDDYFGPALNRVARLLSTGYGGQVLLSTVTYELVGDNMPDRTGMKDLGEHSFKDLLRPEEQQLFQRLSVFVNGCTLEAAEEVCTAAGQLAEDVLEGLVSLVDKSLLRQAEEVEESEPRFWMLQTLREFGLEVLAASGEIETTQQAHAGYYLDLAERVEPRLRTAQQSFWLARLESEHDNMRAAMRWSVEHREMEMALRFGGALWYFWALHGYWSEGRTFLERSLTASGEVVKAIRAKALIGAGVLIGNQGDHKQGKALCEESLALFREIGEPQGIALALLWQGEIAWWTGNLAEPRRLMEEALSLYRTMDDEWGVTSSLEILASVALDQGEYTRARSLLEESLALSRKAGDKRGIANSLLAWSWMLLFSEGDYVKIRHLP